MLSPWRYLVLVFFSLHPNLNNPAPYVKVRYRVFVTSKGHRQLYIDGEEHRRLAALRASMANASASDDDSDDDW